MYRLLVILCLFISACLCHAEGGFYVGIGAGYTSMTDIPLGSVDNGSDSNQYIGAATAAVSGGYNFNHIVGVQLDYAIAYNAVGPGYNPTQQLVDAAVLVHLPFGFIISALSDFSLFVKGGVGYSTYAFNNIANNCTTCVNPPNGAYAVVPVYGLGAEYGFGPIGIKAEWDHSGDIMVPNQGRNQISISSNMYLLSVLYYF